MRRALVSGVPRLGPMERISVVGSSGAGKSTFARKLAARLGVAHIELDSLWHDAGWTNPSPEEFVRRAASVASGERWITDGNYSAVTVNGPIWERADTVIVLHIPRRVVMRQVTVRTIRRAVRREELWNGNREPRSNFYRWDPEKNVIRWAWTRYEAVNERYREAARDPRYAHIQFIFLGSHAESEAFLRDVVPTRRSLN